MRGPSSFFLLALLASVSTPLRYDPSEVDYNLNTNQDAIDPLDYTASWDGHTYQPSPENWRFPFYSFFLDRFVNGDPTNDNANGTAWEHDPMGTQLRHGGDMRGLQDSLDYLHGLGIRGIYLAGSLLLNLPWSADSYSPLDHTLLDRHFGDIDSWREAIQAIHDRGMYVILDNTMSTMSDLIGFQGYLNSSAPWSFQEHNVLWKSGRRYHDFQPSNEWEEVCSYPYPRFWDQGGHLINDNYTQAMVGCRDSEFNQYGEVGAFGTYPEWQKQLSKFNGVQDRLREWRPSVRTKLEHFSCMVISSLDIDGFRMDKGLQIPVDAQGNFSAAMRECARQYGKNNFFIPGEIVNGNVNGAVYIGRGKEPSMMVHDTTLAITTNTSDYIRDEGQNALDAAAFHYSTYRSLMRFLGLDGDLLAVNDVSVNFADAWHQILRTNDLFNANSGKFDPRHMYGVSNQDVFRWPGITDGTQRQLLGAFITTLEMPGIPLMSWGEEQGFYILDNTAPNYLYGRQAMSSAQAWQIHGCYKVGTINLNDMPLNSSLHGCEDDSVSLDHRDPAHPVYAVYKMLFELRSRYPALQDGWMFLQLSNQTFNYTLPGSFGVPTETGIWSSIRSRLEGVQDFTGIGQGNQSIWTLRSNQNISKTFEFDCNNNDTALIAPFNQGTTVKNLFHPFDEYTLVKSPQKRGFEGSIEYNGCLPAMNMTKYGFKAFVPVSKWRAPSPLITKFLPGHDQRILSTVSRTEQESVDIEFRFSDLMDCDSVTSSLSINSTTADGSTPQLDAKSVSCLTITSTDEPIFDGGLPSIWAFTATLTNVSNGVHSISVKNATNQAKNMSTNAIDKFMFRIGQSDNPMVFPKMANYSSEILFKETNSRTDSTNSSGMYLSHKAAGADSFRYSLTWGSSWSDWQTYTGENSTLVMQTWSGTEKQKWEGDHVRVQYWSRMTGSSDHIQEGDLFGSTRPTRRFPHLFVHGPWNEFGYDSGIANRMSQQKNGTWQYNFMTEWPAQFQINVWGMNPDGEPDVTAAFGDVDNDTVLDRIAPVSLEQSIVNITNLGPESPHLAYRIQLNDGDYRYTLIPVGSRWKQLALFILLAVVPPLTAAVAVWAYLRVFYQVKFNQVGLSEAKAIIPFAIRNKFSRDRWLPEKMFNLQDRSSTPSVPEGAIVVDTGLGDVANGTRRTVLIGTMEYDIEDWGIKIKIGGLGVMAQLMGKNLAHQNLIWVVPCVGGIDYPEDQPGEPMLVKILGNNYEVQVQYHVLNNITYVLLDAPVFRKQTKSEPYPPRMDDLDSAIYYSAWNQCIAETMRRFPIDLYHINDYHGTVAPLYILPSMIPCCLSLHNAEFQGLWPMRTPKEREEICAVFNLPQEVVQRYVQFGEIFNLLHAGASILRIHQNGFGAVGVSKKYGKRSYARYPIFWGLKKIGALPNPDPSDVAEWDKKLSNPNDVVIDRNFEDARAGLKRQAQEWAGLEQRADADLFVFVGRWSMQKGIDLIADVFPAILEEYPQAQLLCIGPVIDLYGKFAALKLDKMMAKYPGRVYSKPEFTALPPFIFSGAEFALIPSRDEPFGLVAVEFGRKGALGVGSRVGGLGQMPGWWFTIESTTTKHLLHQFKMAIHAALKSGYEIRATMRARSAKQRFPVAQWKEDLEILQSTSIKLFKRRVAKLDRRVGDHSGTTTPRLGSMTPRNGSVTPRSGWQTPRSGWATPNFLRSPANSAPVTRESSPVRAETPVHGFSLGRRSGPGHALQQKGPWSRSSSAAGSARTSLESVVSHERSESPSLVGPAPMEEPRRGRPLSTIVDEGMTPRTQAQNPFDEHKPPTKLLPIIAGRTSPDDEYHITSEQAEASRRQSYLEHARYDPHDPLRDGAVGRAYPMGPDNNSFEDAPFSAFSPEPSVPGTPSISDGLITQPHPAQIQLSLEQVLNEKKDKRPQNLMPFFTDPTGLYYKTFSRKLDDLNGKNSEGPLCVEEYLMKSEKQWFNRLHEAKMGRSTATTPVASRFPSRATSPARSAFNDSFGGDDGEEPMSQFLLPENYRAPTGLMRVMNTKIGDWPVYAFLLAFGQILAANSYQITLLTGENGEAASKLYTVACIYLAASIVWWCIFRRFQSLYVLTAPWAFYGLAFFLLGMAPHAKSTSGRGWVQNVATGFYGVASASGSFFFAQNFGSMGSAPVKTWGFRACVIQGTQQIYIVLLWFWGSRITNSVAAGRGVSTLVTYGSTITAITIPIAILLWAIGAVLFFGLPEYYRQAPGAVPSFYTSVWRRKVIVWFFVAVFIQNYFLSAPYGRNWKYLWSSQHAPAWAIVLLIAFFFVAVWAALLFWFSQLSTTHSWILPLFAIGLGAPRWCQMLWSTSNIGAYLPWAGGPIASALLGRGLWLWLGVLDSLQGVGFGMILLQTLTRFHITFTLISAQAIGSVATILARATAPDKVGPGDVFPDFSAGYSEGLGKAWFWIALLFQGVVCVGFFTFFRKEQLSKP